MLLAVPLLAASLVSAQLSSDLPPPEPYPDLQIDGEWWFYKLLDSQFPHDIVPLLPIGAVSGQGQQLQLLDLPMAQYVMLEFFAPWCPHCQHFAPELAKVAQVLSTPQAQQGALVAILAVDCEKLELEALCDWAEANMFPKLALATREVLLGQLGQFASQTPGVATLFPVTEATEVMPFLQQNVPNWPADIPQPEASDDTAPFFGWSQPPEGVTEPSQAPLQDVAVGIASLLHGAFSKTNLDEADKVALLNLLQLLCAAGPGAVCRQSACTMRFDLETQWDSLISQAVISHNGEGESISPVAVNHLDWSRFEHEHQFCGRPWPDFAQESWSWCRGRTPGTRGYTCGLWMTFHSLLAGIEQAPPDIAAGLPQPPLHVIRGVVEHFFGCQSCQQHFLEMPVQPEDVATPEAQMLWLWDAHNQATVRIGLEERQHSPVSPLRVQWPNQMTCPECVDGYGNLNRPQVAQQLRKFYGTAYNDESQAGGGGAPPAWQRKFALPQVGVIKLKDSFAHHTEAGHSGFTVGFVLVPLALAALTLGLFIARRGRAVLDIPAE